MGEVDKPHWNKGRVPYNKFTPEEDQRDWVYRMARVGTPQDQIAAVVGIGVTTLRKYFAVELQTAMIEANTQVANSLFSKTQYRPAEYDDEGKLVVSEKEAETIAIIFWLKARAGWSDRPKEKEVDEGITLTPQQARDAFKDMTPAEREAVKKFMQAMKDAKDVTAKEGK